ncbi:MAG: RsmD family RNA methyltransferase [Nanoarchaeota archaeon]|nr:RsmD family RNA methyltransferase [Nanoarchaeota archaeon]
MVRTRKELAIYLSKLKVFEHPHIQLEQYPSDGDVAAKLLWEASNNGNIENQTIIDLGCGTGILGIGALLLGAKHIVFVDIDATVFSTLKENIKILEEEYEFPGTFEFVNSDVSSFNKNLIAPETDTENLIVTMNPPFGTKIKHADKKFLECAKRLSNHIYSMHKTTTKVFLEAYARTNEFEMAWQETTSFPLKNVYKNDRKKIERIEVDLIYLRR